MDVQEAVAFAKKHIADLFAHEGAKNIGLEEVEYDETTVTWRVTVGFSRPWDEVRSPLASLAGGESTRRVYKVVLISDFDKGKVLSIKDRQLKP